MNIQRMYMQGREGVVKKMEVCLKIFCCGEKGETRKNAMSYILGWMINEGSNDNDWMVAVTNEILQCIFTDAKYQKQSMKIPVLKSMF